MLLIALLLLFTTTISILFLLKIKGRVEFILAGYVISNGLIVVMVEILSLLRAITPAFLLFCNLIILLPILYIFWRTKPQLYDPFKNTSTTIKSIFADRLDIFLFAGLIGVGFILFALVNRVFWIEEFDAVVYHVPRIVYWMQHQSLLPWEESILNPRVAFPFNAEIIELWVTLFWDTDQLIPFVPWFAGIIAVVAVYGLAVQLKFSKQNSLFIAFIFSAMPVVAWQSKLILSHDINTAVEIVAAVYFLLEWQISRRTEHLVLAGSGMGLALGTKLSAFYALPGFAVLVLIFAFSKQHSESLKRKLTFLIYLAIPVILLGSYVYIQNMVYFDSFLGSSEGLSVPMTFDLSDPRGYLHTIQCLGLNIFRNLYYLFVAGESKFQLAIASVFSNIFSFTLIESNICVAEFPFTFVPTYLPPDRSTGLQAPFILLPGVVYAVFYGIRENKKEFWYLLIVALSFLIFHSLTTIWSPLSRRYYTIPFALLFPICIPFLERITQKKLIRYIVLFISVVGYFVIYLMYSAFQLTENDVGIFTSQKYSQQVKKESLTPMIYYTDQLIPKDSTVGIIFSRDWGLVEYPVWGQHFTRQLDRGVCEQLHAEEIITADTPFLLVGVECQNWLDTRIKEADLLYDLVFELGSAALYKHPFAELETYQVSSPDDFPADDPLISIISAGGSSWIQIIPVINRGSVEEDGFVKEYLGISKDFEITRVDIDTHVHFIVETEQPLKSVIVEVAFSPINWEDNGIYTLQVLNSDYHTIDEAVAELPAGETQISFETFFEFGMNHLLVSTADQDSVPSLKIDHVYLSVQSP